MPLSRRTVLKWMAYLCAVDLLPSAFALPDEFGVPGSGNFKRIYGDEKLRAEFFRFLQNVFHLYPEEKLHVLISEIVRRKNTDVDIYVALQSQLETIKPLFGDFTYALPALHQQKREMTEETVRLLAGRTTVNGYMEIGTPGRYVHGLESRLALTGNVYLVHDHEPAFAMGDIFERGSIGRVGTYVPLANYGEWGSAVHDGSLELVTNFIGLHHAPAERLEGFVKSIRRVLKPGGTFILRDHDVASGDLGAMVGLAHDVYNAGIGAAWAANRDEVRHFKSLAQIETYLAGFGFTRQGDTIFQDGDPTKNALMKFKRT